MKPNKAERQLKEIAQIVNDHLARSLARYFKEELEGKSVRTNRPFRLPVRIVTGKEAEAVEVLYGKDYTEMDYNFQFYGVGER